jgi:formylglycine-generating enzyme required for sulfatase activity
LTLTPPTAFRRAASRAALLVFALGGLGPAACESPDAPAEKDPLGDVAFVPWYGSPGGGYFLGLTEVSNGAFDAFLRSTRYRRDDPAFLHHWSTGDGGVKTLPPSLANHPVVHVNGLDARAYARWKGMRLPTSREWDWAAGYGVNGGFPFGLWRPLRANTLELGLDHTTPVGLFENGRSLLGFYDLS